MKLLLPVLLLFIASALKVEHQEQQTQEKHQLDPFTVGVAAVGAVMALTKLLEGMFVVTCGKGYKRGVNINVLNKMSAKTITSLGHYEDSGKVLEYGDQEIPPNQYSKYYFVKHSGSATGSCGVTAWKLTPSDALIIFYENPWSSWNFQGACIYRNLNGIPTTKFQPLPKTRLRQFYNTLYNLGVKNRDWPGNCLQFNNQRSKDQNWFMNGAKTEGAYYFEVAAKYEYLDNAGPNDCYTAEVDVMVADAGAQ